MSDHPPPPDPSAGAPRYTHAGETQTLAAWADRLGIKFHTLCRRLAHGWSVEETLGRPAPGG